MNQSSPPKAQKVNPIRSKAKVEKKKIKSLNFVTGNKNKLLETSKILQNTIPKLVSINLDLPELQGSSPEEISRAKCRIASKSAGKGVPVIVEDTSLCFNALNGLPGPYIKWFLDSIGHEGLNKLIEGYEDKSAYALCIFSYSDDPEKEPKTFIGKCHGKIVPPRGPPNSFGWDPIFQPDGFDETFAEMSKEVKNTISHRLLALDQFKAYVEENPHILLGDDVTDGQYEADWDETDGDCC
jgi:inosine triphosphate pyrophosphatase